METASSKNRTHRRTVGGPFDLSLEVGHPLLAHLNARQRPRQPQFPFEDPHVARFCVLLTGASRSMFKYRDMLMSELIDLPLKGCNRLNCLAHASQSN
jgi:hypothetical protein